MSIGFIAFVSLVVGAAVGGLVWVGWSFLENLRAMREQKASEAEPVQTDEPEQEQEEA